MNKKTLNLLYPFIGLTVVTVLFAVLIGSLKGGDALSLFFQMETWKNIITTSVIVGIGALGMTFVIISKGLDLSVGSMIALATVIMALALNSNSTVEVSTRAGDKFQLQEILQSQSPEVIKDLKDAVDLKAEATNEQLKEKLTSKRTEIANKFNSVSVVAPDSKSVSWKRASMSVAGGDVIIAIIVTILCCAVAGFFNGFVSVKFGIMPFIVTLGTMQVFRGLAKIFSEQQTISTADNFVHSAMRTNPDPAWLFFAPGVWLMIFLMVTSIVILRYTVFGRYVYAIGSSENTATLCGLPVKATRLLIYTLCGALTGIAGIMQYANISGIGDPTAAVGKELDIIAAVVIGGASLDGGEGSALGAVIGAVIMSVLRSGCTFLGISDGAQDVLIGSIIVVAVGLDKLKHRKKA